MSGTYAEIDGPANMDNGSVEGVMTGGAHKTVSKANRAEMQRRALQSKPTKSKLLDGVSLEALIRGMGPNQLYVPFANNAINDWRNGDLGPRGLYSAVVINAFLDGLENLSGVGLKDPESMAYALRQAASLMREAGMPASQISAFNERHDLDQAA